MTALARVQVESFGRIARADVELRPLMLFVGPNNSGKSYLASLLWALPRLAASLFDGVPAAWNDALAWLTERSASDATRPISPPERATFANAFNSALRNQKDAVASRLLNCRGQSLGRVEVEPLLRGETTLRITQRPKGGSALGYVPHGTPTFDAVVGSSHADDLGFIARCLTGYLLFGNLGRGHDRNLSIHEAHTPVFVPASRSGFMLLGGPVARSGLDRFRIESGDSSLELTGPMLQFLDLLLALNVARTGPHAEEAAFLESALEGTVRATKSPVGSTVTYQPAGSERGLSLALASSLVTELAPLVLILRHVEDCPLIVLEEPEAHLHPRLQRHLARTVVRLVRKGVFVWITTHSENFCQQINNALKLGSAKDREGLASKSGLDPAEYLSRDEVAGYELVLGERGSTTRPLAMTRGGLVMPSFNEELVSLSRQALKLDELLEAEHESAG